MSRVIDVVEVAVFAGGVLVLIVPFLLVAAGLLGVLLLRRVPDGQLSTPVVRARRRGWAVALLAGAAAVVIVGLALAAAPGANLRQGQLLAAAPLAAATLYAAVVLVGELTWPRPRTRVRSARLVARSIADAAPPWLLRVAIGSVLLLAVVCGLGTALADTDGRSLSYTWSTGNAAGGGSHSPFPGAFYAAPVAIVLVVLVLVTGAVLHRVPQRPALLDVGADLALRQAAGVRVLRAATAAVLVTTAAFLLIGSLAARGLVTTGVLNAGNGDPGPGPLHDPLSWVGLALGGVLLLAGLAVLLVPAPRVRA